MGEKLTAESVVSQEYTGRGQRGAEDKVLYNKYNRGADIMREDAHIKPAIDPVVYDIYRESTTDDIVADREWDELCDLIHQVYIKSDLFELEENDPAKLKEIFESQKRSIDELQVFYRMVESEILKVYPDTTKKEILYAICESLQLNYKKVWDSVLTPKEKHDILSTINLKNKVSEETLSSSLF